ncbi:ATP synthase F0 subunit B [Streptomyces sp. NPDC101209]|uniref:ATP synthase F0 subunit B n=1 Tax=Streptomyces sp. NPDC101209 TaxID=3366129 RepID=UPI0037F16913
MTQSDFEVAPDDAAAITAYEAALRGFAIKLNRLRIAFGAPSYDTIAKASGRPKLTKAGLSDALSGKRLPSLEAMLEFVRVVGSLPTSDQPATGSPSRDEWRKEWQEVKFLQLQAQSSRKRVRATAQGILDEALREADALLAATREEAARLRAEAVADGQGEADALLAAAHEEVARLRAESVAARDRRGALKDLDAYFAPASESTASSVEEIMRAAGWQRPRSQRRKDLPNPSFTPFYFKVPTVTSVRPADGRPQALELRPGTWYKAVRLDGDALVVELRGGQEAILEDPTGIQRSARR